MFNSLRWKFTTWYVITSIVAVLAVGLLILYAESRALNHRLEGSIRSAGDAVRAATAANLQQSYANDPVAAANEAVETVAAHGSLHSNDVHVVLLDPSGAISANPEDVDFVELGRGASFERALKDGETWHTAHIYGSDVRVKTFPLTDNDGRLIGFVQAAKSIEDNNAALVTLGLVMLGGGITGLALFALGGYLIAGKAIEPVRRGYERQRQFVADASHELRTPLTVIRTNTGMLLRHRDADPAVQDIDAEARYMTQLLDNLLMLADGDQHALRISAGPVNLSDVAHSAARSVVALATTRDVRLRTDLNAPAIVNSDADACREVVFILLDNAIKYTPPGGEVVLTTATAGNDAIVEVRDTGIGMTADELSQATERFYRGNRARTRLNGGGGLGLSIAQELATALGGQLELESEPGKGTKARLRLALETATEAAKSNRAPSPQTEPPI